jgi:FkbM family methyltransferase
VSEEGDLRRLMFMANAPWCTSGYGVQGKHLMPILKKYGWAPAYFAFYGLQNGMMTVDDTPVYPMGTQPWGEDILPGHMAHHRATVLITLMDVWVTNFFGPMSQKEGWLWCPWTPIDQEPVPPLVKERLAGCYTALPYSRHGEAALKIAGVQSVRYIPHAVDTKVFRPPEPGERAGLRKKFKIPEDAYVIGMVAANKGWPSRKCLPEQLWAFREFKKTHPNAVMYMHTLRTTAHRGINLEALCQNLELVIDRDVIFSDQYTYLMGWSEKAIADLYRTFDVLSLTSQGEGFGIPLIEAQATGVPVVTTNASAMTELTFSGVCIKETNPFWTGLDSWAATPDVHAIVGAYDTMYEWLQDPAKAKILHELARAGALPYDWEVVGEEYWAPFLADLERDVKLLKSTHRWTPTMLVNHDGTRSQACLDKDCPVERVTTAKEEKLVLHGMQTTVDGVAMTLEDDPDAGVAKLVCREILGAYRLNKIPFEDGDHVIDGGAHVGVVSIWLALKYPKIKIFAFEPMPDNFERLLRNIEANGVREQVIPFNMALTGDGRKIRIGGMPKTNSGGWSYFGPDERTTDGAVSVEIESTTICKVLAANGIEKLKLLKLDVEGMEYEILAGDCSLNRVDYLVGELHNSPMLEKLGYTSQALAERLVMEMGEAKVNLAVSRMG